MDPSDASSQHRVGVEPPSTRRRMSMEEDFYYRELMTSRPSKPPSYDSAMKAALAAQRRAALAAQNPGSSSDSLFREMLPNYSCDVHLEGVFMRKMEIEDTTKRAEFRNWQMVYVELHGTAMNIYDVKKERGWWSTKNEGPGISPDRPPWVKKAKLEKSYSLLHGDAGIAADYRKRRHVIRVRAETDQFLLSCVELPTFVKWLDHIFAAIAVAAAIDDREFPRDQSIPRIQRIRWLRGQQPQPEDNGTGFQRLNERRQSNASSTVTGDLMEEEAEGDGALPPNSILEEENPGIGPSTGSTGHPIVGRLSTTSYPNEAVDPDTGKWHPRHQWTETHDHLYAKLCYAVLLFKSPRKSNFIIDNGKQWYVDWKTGRMIRVLPPAYGESDFQHNTWTTTIATENRLI